jgi:hypothetical protein
MTNSVKEEAKHLIDTLSENSTWDELMDKIYVRQAIESGLTDSKSNRVLTVEEVRSRFGLTP